MGKGRIRVQVNKMHYLNQRELCAHAEIDSSAECSLLSNSQLKASILNYLYAEKLLHLRLCYNKRDANTSEKRSSDRNIKIIFSFCEN